MALTPSVVINGADVRAEFGFEVLTVQGNRSLNLRVRSATPALDHGEQTQGGLYEPATLRLTGWIPAANRAALMRHLFLETRFPGSARLGGWCIVKGDVAGCFRFESVKRFECDPMTQQWRVDPQYNLTVELEVGEAFSLGFQPHRHGLALGPVTSFAAASSTSPVFAILAESPEVFGVGFRGAQLQLVGPSVSQVAVYGAEYSGVHDFNGTLIGRGVRNEQNTAVLHGYQTSPLVTDGDMEAANVTSWPATLGTRVKIGLMGTQRVMEGTQCLKFTATSSDGYVAATVGSLSSGVEYRVAFWIHCETAAVPEVRIYDPSSTLVFQRSVTSMGAAASGKTRMVEFVFLAASTGVHSFRIHCPTNGTICYIDDFVVVASKMTGGSFATGGYGSGNPSGWSKTGSPTTAEETSDYWGKSTAWRIAFADNTQDVRNATATLTSGKAYHVSGKIKSTAGSGAIRINTGSDDHPLQADFVVRNVWTRFSFHFLARAGSTFTLVISSRAGVATNEILLDAVSICQLEPKVATDAYFFEPAIYGKGLQLKIGECAVVTNHANGKSLTAFAQVLPRFGRLTDDLSYGTCGIFQIVRNKQTSMLVLWDDGANTAKLARCGTTVDAITASAAYAGGVRPLVGSTLRGCLGLAFRWDDGNWSAADPGTRMFMEEPDAAAGNLLPFAQESGPPQTSVVAHAANPDRVILSDPAIWAGFWVLNFARERTKILGDLISQSVPVNLNRSMLSNTSINAGETLELDMDRGYYEKWSSAVDPKRTNVNWDGEMPRWAECPVIYSQGVFARIAAYIKVRGR
jgi:hypothetical protein